MDSTGGQARLIWHTFGEYDFNICTTWCQLIILPTPNSNIGFRSTATTTSCIGKESQALQQRSVFERLRVLPSRGMQVLLVGANSLNNCVHSRCNSVTTSCHHDGTLPTPSRTSESIWYHQIPSLYGAGYVFFEDLTVTPELRVTLAHKHQYTDLASESLPTTNSHRLG